MINFPDLSCKSSLRALSAKTFITVDIVFDLTHISSLPPIWAYSRKVGWVEGSETQHKLDSEK